MATEINLERPEYGVQYEHQRLDSYLRSYLELRHFAKLNGFEDKLIAILKRYGGQALLDLEQSRGTTIQKRVKLLSILPKLKQAIDTSRKALKGYIKAARKGFTPLIDRLVYRFADNDGHLHTFVLDPSQRASKTLQDFEGVIHDSPCGMAIYGAFNPTFKSIRKTMIARWGWEDKPGTSAIATLLTIKQLCDIWAGHKPNTAQDLI